MSFFMNQRHFDHLKTPKSSSKMSRPRMTRCEDTGRTQVVNLLDIINILNGNDAALQTCADGSCVPANHRCPEDDCPSGMQPCKASQKCYLANDRCDQMKHCPDGTDEHDCGDACGMIETYCPAERKCVIVGNPCPNESCPRDRPRRCADKTQCYRQKERCDGFINCFDKSDELNCSPEGIVFVPPEGRKPALGTTGSTPGEPRGAPVLGVVLGLVGLIIVIVAIIVCIWACNRKKIRREANNNNNISINVDSRSIQGMPTPNGALPCSLEMPTVAQRVPCHLGRLPSAPEGEDGFPLPLSMQETPSQNEPWMNPPLAAANTPGHIGRCPPSHRSGRGRPGQGRGGGRGSGRAVRSQVRLPHHVTPAAPGHIGRATQAPPSGGRRNNCGARGATTSQAASSRQELNHEPVGEMVAPPSYEEVMAESSNFTMISQNISLNIN